MIKKKNKIKNIHLKGNVPCDIVENSSIASSTLPMEKKYDPIDRRKKLFLKKLLAAKKIKTKTKPKLIKIWNNPFLK